MITPQTKVSVAVAIVAPVAKANGLHLWDRRIDQLQKAVKLYNQKRR